MMEYQYIDAVCGEWKIVECATHLSGTGKRWTSQYTVPDGAGITQIQGSGGTQLDEVITETFRNYLMATVAFELNNAGAQRSLEPIIETRPEARGARRVGFTKKTWQTHGLFLPEFR
jgi:hypothetical protein